MSERPGWTWWGLLLLWPMLAFLQQWQVTPEAGIPWVAAVGGMAGIVGWKAAQGARVRARAVGLALAGLWLGCLLLLAGLDRWAELSRMLGSDHWILLKEAVQAGLGAFCLVAALRTLSWRFPALAVVELGVASGICVTALEAHRDGYINRPFQIVDPLWLRGMDPTPLFLGVGALTLMVVALVALNRPNNRRPWWDVPLLLGLLLALYLLVPTGKVKQIFEKFGMGDRPGEENRLRPKSSKSGKGSDPSEGGKNGSKDKEQQKKDDPSFEDTPPPPKPQPVAVVVFRDDYEPPAGGYYFRQSSNSQFNGLKLVHSNDARFDQDFAQNFPTRFRDAKEGKEDLGLVVPPLETTYFHPLATRVALLSQHIRPFGLDNAVAYWAAGNPDPSRFQKAYDVDSQVFEADYAQLVSASAGEPDWDDETWKHYLEGPSDPRYRQLADEIVQKLPPERRNSPLFKAVAIKLWLDENCTYSLKSPSAEAEDPVSDFLFGQRIGYCVYTSHSACYLYRAAGVPARISHGYAVSAQQRGGGSSLLIRTSDAHSWAEIHLQGVGWMELDVSPKKNLEPEKEQVDNNLQQMMGDMARKDKKEARPEDSRPSLDLQEFLRSLVLGVLQAIPWSLLGVWLLLNAWKIFRRVAPWVWTGPALSRLAYLCVLEMLVEQGTRRSRHESCEGFARRLGEEVPSLMQLTRLHLGLRLGAKNPPTTHEVRQCLRECLSQLRRRPVKGWRAWLGWLDFTAGLRVR